MKEISVCEYMRKKRGRKHMMLNGLSAFGYCVNLDNNARKEAIKKAFEERGYDYTQGRLMNLLLLYSGSACRDNKLYSNKIKLDMEHLINLRIKEGAKGGISCHG